LVGSKMILAKEITRLDVAVLILHFYEH